MNPVIRRLQVKFLFPSLTGNAKPLHAVLAELGPQFYSNVLSNHAVLNLEYSVLCQLIHKNLTSTLEVNQELLIEQIIAALMIAELLEHLYHHYLGVPREVRRLRQQKQIYRELLTGLGHSVASNRLEPPILEDDVFDVGLSLSQKIRETTLDKNIYRLLLVRTKRLLDFIYLVGTNSERFQKFVLTMDKIADPILPYLAWCYFTPRLITNLFLLLKHTLPGIWMSENEKSVDWKSRFQGQLLRRWFELGNDSVWVVVGLINCFLLTGSLAPAAVYLNLVFFAYDIMLSGLRTYIELKQIAQLLQEYEQQLDGECSDSGRDDILAFKSALLEIQNFENLRLGLHLLTTVVIFVGMSLAIPALASLPVFPLIGSLIIVGITLTGFILGERLEKHRPVNEIKKPSGVVNSGFFSKSAPQVVEVQAPVEMISLQTNI